MIAHYSKFLANSVFTLVVVLVKVIRGSASRELGFRPRRLFLLSMGTFKLQSGERTIIIIMAAAALVSLPGPSSFQYRGRHLAS